MRRTGLGNSGMDGSRVGLGAFPLQRATEAAARKLPALAAAFAGLAAGPPQ